jgi:hypothetical protein
VWKKTTASMKKTEEKSVEKRTAVALAQCFGVFTRCDFSFQHDDLMISPLAVSRLGLVASTGLDLCNTPTLLLQSPVSEGIE